MSGRVRHWFLADDGRWILHWQPIYSEPEFLDPPRPDYEFDIILAQSRLTKKQLFVVECHYGFRGPAMTEREIAALMGVTQQAVHRLIERALANLRKGLSKSPIDARG